MTNPPEGRWEAELKRKLDSVVYYKDDMPKVRVRFMEQLMAHNVDSTELTPFESWFWWAECYANYQVWKRQRDKEESRH